MDPFTVVTGSAGLLSTGITVCHGLISYCRSYRSREEDLSGLQHNAEQLKTQLQLLENRHETAPSKDQNFRDAMHECITTCRKCLIDLGQLSEKYSPPSTGSDPRSRRQVLSRKFRYPFQKAKFESFREHIHDLHVVLLGYFASLNNELAETARDESRAQAKDLSSLMIDGTEAIKYHIDAIIPGLSRRIDIELAKTGDAFTRKLDTFHNTLEHTIKNNLDTFLQPSLQLKPYTGPPEMMMTSTHAGQSRNISLSQEARRAPQRNNVLSKTAETQTLVLCAPQSCNCLTSPRRPQPCGKQRFHTRLKRNRKTLSGQLRVFNYLFQIRVAIDFSQRAFLSDLQIQPSLTVRATVPSDSPAFTLVSGVVHSIETNRNSNVEEFQVKVQDCLRGLKDLFFSGYACPTDVNSQRNNLIDVACRADGLGHLQPEMVHKYSDFIEGLAHLGIPLSQEKSGTDLWLSHFALSDVCRMHDDDFVHQVLLRTFARLGADLWDTAITPMPNPGAYILRALGQDMLGQHYSIGYPELSYALLQRSDAKVQYLLSGRCNKEISHLLQAKGPWDQTALHVSTTWPQGLQLLFDLAGEATEDVLGMKDDTGKTALDYAADLGEIDSVKILVTAGHAEIDLELPYNLFKLQHPRNSQKKLRFFAQILAEHRRQLTHLAFRTLNLDTQLERRTRPSNMESILQEDAFEVIQQLKAMGTEIPQTLRHVQPGSIYHSLYSPSVDLLEALYQAGFSHTNVSYLGFCPLMSMMHLPLKTRRFERLHNSEDTIDLLEVIIWFVDHGADLYRPIPRIAIIGSPEDRDGARKFRLIHQLSEGLGHFTGEALTASESVEVRLASMLRKIVTSTAADPCTCFCSPQGCTAVSLLARQGHDLQRKVEAFFVVASLDSGSEATSRVVSGLLRLLTFEKLGMSHTCCKYVHESRSGFNRGKIVFRGQFQILELMDPEEIGEIQEEDKYLSLRLEELVLEFEEQYRTLGKPFGNFFVDYWLPRIKEIDAEEENIDLSPEEEEAIRNTGVVLNDTRD